MHRERLFMSPGLHWAIVAVVPLILPVHRTHGQTYPRWFLETGVTACEAIAVGYANPSVFKDSSAAQAVRQAREAFAQDLFREITGGEEYWSTEIGTFWLGTNRRENFDTTMIGVAGATLIPLDTMVTESMTIVFMGGTSCALHSQARQRASVRGSRAPTWIESPPADPGYYYGVGVAPEYFYESSSWMHAESAARRNLARSVHITLEGLQKMSGEGQEKRREEFSVALERVRTIARWRDVKERIFYVLVRMPR